MIYTRSLYKVIALIITASLSLLSCKKNKPDTSLFDEIAVNEEVANYLKGFEGRGDLTDNRSQPTIPEEALDNFRYPNDLALDLVLHEPAIHQPLYLNFDHRGRLWVVQYNQYPYPKGLKVTSIDNHLRLKFDTIPRPPPKGIKGADRITFFEDTNGDGNYDKATDAITGLNIATSVTFGRGSIWVLSPPYLLSYPDPDDDGLPNGIPEVHLEGFGLEDTHAVANSLHWGPDGWLYGAQGSTTTAKISSSVSKNVAFQGQAIWRYHPASHIFEIFAEGGGNTFDVEIDAKGRIYSGDNGEIRGHYYKQGGYYVKNWGKHGPHTNPYTFGHIPNMTLEGASIRFTHAFIKYEGASLPERYHQDMMAINPLQSYVQLARFEASGSTFNNVDEERILETDDHWFRPVDIKVGPDGSVYLADWYDSRLSHVDPRDTWHKASGRIYRLRNKESKSRPAKFDLSNYSNADLVALLSHPNKWFRQQALRLMGDRKDGSIIPKLIPLLTSDSSTIALEALWAINACGAFNDSLGIIALKHHDPFVRMWGVRLFGDANKVSRVVSAELQQLAAHEPHPEVRSQMASTAKRLPGNDAMHIIKNLLMFHDDQNDRDIPLQIWWAIESKLESAGMEVLAIFEDPSIWSRPTVQETILERLMQRYIMSGGPEHFAAAAQLIAMSPSVNQSKVLINGLQEGLRGRDIIGLPPVLVKALQPYQKDFREASLSIALRQGQRKAVAQAISIIADDQAKIGERLSYIKIFGETNQPKSIPTMLDIVEAKSSSGALRQAVLQSLQRYDKAEIGERVVKTYPFNLRSDPDVREAALALFATRPRWVYQLLDAIDGEKEIQTGSIARTISKDDVPEQIVRRLKLFNDPTINAAIDRLWPEARLATSSEKNERINSTAQILKSGNGHPSDGYTIYKMKCESCHRLFDQGGSIGPDLTGYDRKNTDDLLLHIIDPNASIREGFVNYQVTTVDERTLVGTIKDRSGGTVTLQSPGGVAIVLSDDQIKDMQAQRTSLMPERLLTGLTDQQICDLFAYLKEDN